MVVEYFTIYARKLKQNQVFRNNLMRCETNSLCVC